MAKKKILIVEDESIVAEDIKRSLQNMGYAVSEIVSSGKEAIKRAKEDKPDLVLMDIVLKGEMSGIEAAGQIRARLNIPVIYLTVYADDKILERAKITEPFGYILKPFEERELHSTIQMALYKHRIERKLKENEQWLATTLKSIGDAVISTDKKGFITFMNPVAEVLTGWKQKDALGKDLTEVFNTIDEETPTPTKNRVTKAIREGGVGLTNDSILITKDGTKTPIEKSAAPIRDDKGDITGTVLVFRDITERKRAEEKLKNAYHRLKQAQNQLIQSEKMAAVNQLAFGIAHEIRNPLATILMGIESVSSDLIEKHGISVASIQKIKQSVNRANNIIADLLKFSRASEPEFKSVNVCELLDNTISLIKNQADLSNVKIRRNFPKKDIQIKADYTMLQQAFFNLCINAIDAMPNGGELSLKVHLGKRSGSNKNKLIIEIADTGKGIPEDKLLKIFDPFFTTKEPGKGTGLGLSIVHLILERHEGTIDIESEVNKGTKSIVRLPVIKST